MSKVSDSMLMEFFLQSLTPEERGMQERLCHYLQANSLVMPSNETLQSELGLSAVFIAKAVYLFENFRLMKAFDDQGAKAVNALLAHRQPEYEALIVKASKEDDGGEHE